MQSYNTGTSTSAESIQSDPQQSNSNNSSDIEYPAELKTEIGQFQQPPQYDPNDFPDEIVIESGKQPKTNGQSYESNEHSDIGNFAFNLFLKELSNQPRGAEIKDILLDLLPLSKKTNEVKIYNPQKGAAEFMPIYEVELTKELSLTLGDIVALAGDFFGIAKRPISFGKNDGECVERFEEAYKSLLTINTPAKSKLVKDVVNHIRDEAEAVHSCSYFNVKLVKQKIKNITNINNIQYGLERMEEKSFHGFWHSPYFDLSLANFDHFGKEAQKAFQIGHKIAIEQARAAGIEQDINKRKESLKEAILLELFACHFLTDLFASGHIRTPRKQILNYLTETRYSNNNQPANINKTPDLDKVSNIDLVIAGFFAKKMHDEDSANGVYVKIDNNDEPWKASGDGNYYKQDNKNHAIKACHVVVAALSDLVLAYNQQETKIDKDLASYIPHAAVDKNKQLRRAPLFEVEEEKNAVICRGNITKSIQKEGVVSGIQQSIGSTHINAAFISSRLFSVKIKPAVVNAAQELKELTLDEIQKLRDKMEEHHIGCRIS